MNVSKIRPITKTDLDNWLEGDETEQEDACDSNLCDAGLMPVT